MTSRGWKPLVLFSVFLCSGGPHGAEYGDLVWWPAGLGQGGS